ncbi:MAG: DUF1272 domain-containing protein [Pseudomonadota bacterium]
MLELRPSCEHCNKPLPPDATDAMICSFECTFCARCVEAVLENVCPNCGGGFCPRPVRPSRAWINGLSVATRQPGTTVVYKPVDPDAHRAWAMPIRDIAAAKR